jgi:hypothetical protein
MAPVLPVSVGPDDKIGVRRIQTQQGDDDLARDANVRSGKAPAGFKKGTIDPSESIADPDQRAYYGRMWKNCGTGGAAHEEGVTFESKSSDGPWGRPRPWKASITLDEAQAGGGKPEATAVRASPGVVRVTEAHGHPWAEGTPLYRENGKWVYAATGPSITDTAVWIGYDSMHVDATLYTFTPEGIYRTNASGTLWIAPIQYLGK